MQNIILPLYPPGSPLPISRSLLSPSPSAPEASTSRQPPSLAPRKLGAVGAAATDVEARKPCGLLGNARPCGWPGGAPTQPGSGAGSLKLAARPQHPEAGRSACNLARRAATRSQPLELLPPFRFELPRSSCGSWPCCTFPCASAAVGASNESQNEDDKAGSVTHSCCDFFFSICVDLCSHTHDGIDLCFRFVNLCTI